MGKTAPPAAMALTFGAYVHADWARPVGIAAVVVMTAVNYRAVEKTTQLTRAIADRRPGGRWPWSSPRADWCRSVRRQLRPPAVVAPQDGLHPEVGGQGRCSITCRLTAMSRLPSASGRSHRSASRNSTSG